MTFNLISDPTTSTVKYTKNFKLYSANIKHAMVNLKCALYDINNSYQNRPLEVRHLKRWHPDDVLPPNKRLNLSNSDNLLKR